MPQGGAICPLLANITLDGLQEALQKQVKHLKKRRNKTISQTETSFSPKVNVIR